MRRGTKRLLGALAGVVVLGVTLAAAYTYWLVTSFDTGDGPREIRIADGVVVVVPEGYSFFDTRHGWDLPEHATRDVAVDRRGRPLLYATLYDDAAFVEQLRESVTTLEGLVPASSHEEATAFFGEGWEVYVAPEDREEGLLLHATRAVESDEVVVVELIAPLPPDGESLAEALRTFLALDGS